MTVPALTNAEPRPPSGVVRRTWAGYALPEVRWAALAVTLFAAGGLMQLSGAPAVTWGAVYLLCYVAGGWEPGLAGLQALRERTLDVDLLMVVAAVVAAAIGQVFDGALLIIIFATSGALEATATRRTRDAVTALLDLAPQQATLVAEDGSERTVHAEALQVNDTIRVRPGERIAADGMVTDGGSDVDQASITGEPMPVHKRPGAQVFAGTMNGAGALFVRVSAPAHESVIARIVTMVEQASETKAKAQLFIDKVEQRYSVAMVAATLALFAVPLAAGAPLQSTLLRAITFMIVASPCAVVLATMPPLLSAIANAGRHGVLVKSAVVMEQLGVVDAIAFDKTGTLTQGAPRVTCIDRIHGAPSERDLLQLAAAAEQPSQHPIAAAIVAAARATGVQRLPPGENFTSRPGQGITATVAGHHVALSTPSGTEGRTGFDDDVARTVATRQADGATAVVLTVDGTVRATISLQDGVRPDAHDAVASLRAATRHEPVLLTGDNQRAADHIAALVGISDARGDLLPEQKVHAIEELTRSGARALLIGDGVNDAPAMAAAHLGIAMGRNGSDLALQTADAVLVRDDLTALSRVIHLSRRARRVVIANLMIATAVITGLVIWDLTGTLPLPLGVAGHETSTVIVGLNGLRLLRAKAWNDSE